MKDQKQHFKNGFTLVELMVAIGVIAIVLILSVPAVSNWMPNYRLKKAATDLHSNFQKAKMTAIKRKCMCTINFNQPVGGTTFDYIVFVDLNNNSEYDGNLSGNGIDEDNDGADDADEIETILSRVEWANYPGVGPDVSQAGAGYDHLVNGDGLPSISFQPNGLPSDEDGGAASGIVYLINDNNRTHSILVSTSGSIRVAD